MAWVSLPVFLILFSAGFAHIVAPQSIGNLMTMTCCFFLELSFLQNMKLIRILDKSSVLILKNTYRVYVMEFVWIMIFGIILFV